MVFYTSDNGSYMYRQTAATEPDHVKDATIQAYYEGYHKANGPFRGTKADIWEAGHHVPFFVRWPGVIKPGSACDRTICHVDLFATAAAVAGTPLPPPSEAAPDSFSLMPLFKGNDADFERAPVVHHSGSGMFAIRDGEWKLVLGNGSGGREEPRGRRFNPPWQLFNLQQDPAETTDLIDTDPEIASKREGSLFQMIADDRSRP